MRTSKNPASLKIAWLLSVTLLGSALWSQTPEATKPVLMQNEPHHRLLLENSYVRVFRFSLPAHDATLLHPHELPYVSVMLGPADFINAVAGKPEAHATLTDGQVGYSRGGFAHSVRTDATPFNNVTIELLQPQGEPRNLCQKIIEAPLDCPPGDMDKLPPGSQKKLFETGEIVVIAFSFDHSMNYSEMGPSQLLVVEQDSALQLNMPGAPSKTLHAGEVLWLEARKKWNIVTPTDKTTRFVLIRFKGIEVAK
ncbi:MAG TPA: hypothetical protein VGH37_15580 [Candidatus Acidoferrum sp.]|jgi:hypothetical protein